MTIYPNYIGISLIALERRPRKKPVRTIDDKILYRLTKYRDYIVAILMEYDRIILMKSSNKRCMTRTLEHRNDYFLPVIN